MISIKTLTAAAVSLGAAGGPGEQTGGSGVTAWIQAEPAGRGQAFTAFVRSEAPFTGRYELISERTGPAGRSSNRQAGAVRAGGGQPVRLSRTALAPLGGRDRYSVVLSIYRGEELVAREERRR